MDFPNCCMNAAYLGDLHTRPPADKPPIGLKDSLERRSVQRAGHEAGDVSFRALLTL